MGKNKMGKYLKYAIGEILLVVVGILIALQINIWNEERKLSASEISLLVDVRDNLKTSKKTLERVANNNMRYNKSNREVYDAIINDLPYQKSLDSAFANLRYWSSPYLTFTAYESLKNRGIDLIKNDSLKKSIINIFESDYAYAVKDYDRAEWVFAESVVYPAIVKHIRKTSNYTSVPNDYEALKKNEEFINMINEINFLRQNGVNVYKRIIVNTEHVINQINDEIKSRK